MGQRDKNRLRERARIARLTPEQLVRERALRRDGKRKRKESINQQRRAIRNKNKARAVALLGGKCKTCSGVFPLCVYDFHHIDADLKEQGVSQFWLRTWERIMPEIDKCTLLCANCHRVLHHGT